MQKTEWSEYRSNLAICEHCGGKWKFSANCFCFFPLDAVCEKCVNGPNRGKNAIWEHKYITYTIGEESEDEHISSKIIKYI